MSGLSPSSARTAAPEIIVVESHARPSREWRDQYLARRKTLEPRVHYYQSGIWYKQYFDSGVLLRVALRLTGLHRWAERNMLAIDVRSLVFAFDALPDAFHGFKLLHLSDLHIDAHPELAVRASAILKGLEADLCLITGDYRYGVIESSDMVGRYLEQVITSINARGGVLGILGNHDTSEDVRTLERLGVRVLLNESVEVRMGNQRLWVAGVDDPSGFQCDDLNRALQGVPASAFTVLMAHTPQLYDEAAQRRIDLYLCGHTHGGQVCLPGIGPVISKANAPRRCAIGVWEHRNMTGFTNRGLGVSGTLARINCPPEITLIELRKTGV
jgi:predicted MPP superfamily phosphohydrolase